MFASLRLNPFIRRDHEQHQVDPAHARQHVAHKALVTGDVDETHANFAAIGCGEFEMGKSNVDGDAAPFFFCEAIGINARKSFDQRSFPVIDMSGRSDDDGPHGRQYRRVDLGSNSFSAHGWFAGWPRAGAGYSGSFCLATCVRLI